MNPAEVTTTEPAILSKAVVRTAQLLEIPTEALASILGISQATADCLTRNEYILSRKRKEWEMGCLLVRVFRSLDAIGGSMAKEWLHGANTAFRGRKPIQVIQTAAGLVVVCRYLEAHCEIPMPMMGVEAITELNDVIPVATCLSNSRIEIEYRNADLIAASVDNRIPGTAPFGLSLNGAWQRKKK